MILQKNKWLQFCLIIYLECQSVFGFLCDNSLGLNRKLPDNEKLPDDRFSASTHDGLHLPKYGRLYTEDKYDSTKKDQVWCASKDDSAPWFQVDLGFVQAVAKILIGSHEFVGSFVKTYTVKYSYNGTLWFDVLENQKAKIFNGPDSYYDYLNETLVKPLVTRFVRIYPKTKEGSLFCMQVELYGCIPKKVCSKNVGLEDSTIFSNERFLASSVYKSTNPFEARLTRSSQSAAWCADVNDKTPWLEIDLMYIRELSEIETQGFNQSNAWTKSFKLNYSMNGKNWKEYNSYQTFTANSNSNEIKMINLDLFLTRFIRILPVSWKDLPCLRVNLKECESPTELTPKLIAGLKDETVIRGEPFDLKCEFNGQQGITIAWNMNGKFLPTDNRISTTYVEFRGNLNTKLNFDRIKGKENGLIFTCLAWYSSLENFYSKSDALITVLSPSPLLNVTKIGSSYIMVLFSFVGNITKDTVGYVLNVSSSNKLSRHQIDSKDEFNISDSIQPYKNYTLAVAIAYLDNEVGDYFSVKVETQQDRPYGAPLNLYVVKIQHDALSCSWSMPEEGLRNGIITHYMIKYKKSVKLNEEPKIIQKVVNKTHIDLYNLEAGVNYEISVQAYTVVGGGPFTHPPFLIFTGEATEELSELNKVIITPVNAAGIGKRLQNITADPNFLNKHDITLTLDILEKVVDVENGSRLIGEALVTAVSNVLKANKTVLDESEISNKTGTRYVRVLEKWLETVDVKEKFLQESSENVVVRKVFIKKLELEEGIKFAESSIAEITIPAEALPKNHTMESVYFVYYRKNKFFSQPSVVEEQCVNGFTVVRERVYTPVVSGEVAGSELKNLSTPVILKFRANGSMDLKASACVYWDFKANENKGGWSKKGCKVHSIVNHSITCHCNHLTNFAAVMDFYAHTSRVCGFHKVVLTWISIVGCFLSMVGLFLTLLTYLLFSQLLKELAAKVLVQLCGAMMIVMLTFMTGFEQVYRPTVCVSVAIILHYFTLVVFMWMLMEALFMYYAFVKVWPPREDGDIFKTAAVAWGVPLVIVVITFATSWNNYKGKHFCHLTGYPLYFAYLAPIGLIITINLLIFLMIMYHLSTRPNSNTEVSTVKISLTRIKRAFGIMILMGLTWGFGFGTASNARLEFSYLFASCNALQGFAIFLFYTVAQPNARKAWYRFLTCDPRSDRKRNADSYYERRRMSSGASNKTNSMHFERTSTCTSTILQRNSSAMSQQSSANGLFRNNSCQLTNFSQMMNTIQEDDSAPTSVTNSYFKDDLIVMPDGLVTAVVESVLIKNAAIKTLGKDDMVDINFDEVNKLKNNLNDSPHHVLEISNSNITDSAETIVILELPHNDSHTLNESFNTIKVNQKSSTINCEECGHESGLVNSIDDLKKTIQSDVSTMTESFENDDGILHSRLFGDYSQDHVSRWLQNNCDDINYDSDSDYSSSYYKTSRSSSVTDLISDSHTNTMRSDGSYIKNLTKEQVLRETLVIGPLRGLGINNNIYNSKDTKSKQSSISNSKQSTEELTKKRNGTICSEGSFRIKDDSPKKKKIQKRSSTLGKKRYLSLEEFTP
ncbi:uncharacterized protein LOC100210872 isoform X2 [Hydra vulgaris]|uniref:Uncharacterized protein LOC100210872 isoform X2 n=1 Tax=Hydra vulgaris TaxID=6087 RepID=A0ABM4DG19_HYDVU